MAGLAGLVTRAGILALAVALLVARSASAAPPKVLYPPEEGDPVKVSLASWGSGKAVEVKDAGYAGRIAGLKIVTHGFYAGGRLLFDPPVDLTEQFSGPESNYEFLEFVVKMNTLPPPELGGVADPSVPAPPTTSFVRVTLVFDGGSMEAVNQPVVLHAASEEGWNSMAIPFAAFHGRDRVKSYKLKELRIFGDTRDEFTIGEIRTTTDSDPIDVDPLESQDVAVNDEVTFTAVATAGLSRLKYSWDFDKSDGFQEDATGPVVTHRFTKPSPPAPKGNDLEPYVVTLTVSDVTGAKQAVKKDVEVIVNP